MNLIDRYVYAVTRGLPKKQREDIEKELRTLIDDMLEQYQGDEPYVNKVERVLIGLGDPELLADSYRESKRYLIGPQNFDNYFFILKIVMGAVFLGISISAVIGSFFGAHEDIIGIFASYIATLFSALMQGFAWVTAAFAIAEYNGVNILDKESKKGAWSIAELPEVPQKEAVISKVEVVVSILFSTIFIGILCFAPQIVAAYINNGVDGTTIIPVFNLAMISKFKMLLVVIFVLEVIKEAIKLYYGRWVLKVSIPLTVISIATAIITVSIFANPAIWNANFAVVVMKYLDVNIAIPSIWSNLRTGFIIVVILSSLIEIVTALYKGIKFNK
jgi:hypothetical protein